MALSDQSAREAVPELGDIWAYVFYVVQEPMAVGETELEMVERHVQQGERHVSRQLEIITAMQFRDQPTYLAESLLYNFEASLRAHKDHLIQLTSN